MCYSAMVEQNLKTWLRWSGARVQMDLFEDLFRRRACDDSVKIAKALEANFLEPRTPQEQRIRRFIDDYQARKTAEWEAEVFKQKRRLADAERSLKRRQTRKAQEDRRIATDKVERVLNRIADLRRVEREPGDSRIFPFWYAPVMVRENGGYLIKPMRYHCRPNGKPASYDARYPGLYNARRDNLEKFWKALFGRHHAMVMASGFFENVALHDYEKRALRPGEKESSLVLHFEPRPPAQMLLACLWDAWRSPGHEDLDSFAIVTDEPPPEVAATGHDRCPIALKPDHVQRWLTPEVAERGALRQLLEDRERLRYEHRRAA